MHDRKYENTCVLDDIEHTIRKPVREAAMNVFLYDRPGMGMSNDVLDCSEDLDGEIVTKAGFTVLIIFNCRTELFLALRDEMRRSSFEAIANLRENLAARHGLHCA